MKTFQENSCWTSVMDDSVRPSGFSFIFRKRWTPPVAAFNLRRVTSPVRRRNQVSGNVRLCEVSERNIYSPQSSPVHTYSSWPLWLVGTTHNKPFHWSKRLETYGHFWLDVSHHLISKDSPDWSVFTRKWRMRLDRRWSRFRDWRVDLTWPALVAQWSLDETVIGMFRWMIALIIVWLSMCRQRRLAGSFVTAVFATSFADWPLGDRVRGIFLIWSF